MFHYSHTVKQTLYFPYLQLRLTVFKITPKVLLQLLSYYLI